MKPGVDLSLQYTDSNSNVSMARKSSQSLQKRLQKLNLLEEFHEQVQDGLNKGHMIELNQETRKELDGFPKSYQLINFVQLC